MWGKRKPEVEESKLREKKIDTRVTTTDHDEEWVLVEEPGDENKSDEERLVHALEGVFVSPPEGQPAESDEKRQAELQPAETVTMRCCNNQISKRELFGAVIQFGRIQPQSLKAKKNHVTRSAEQTLVSSSHDEATPLRPHCECPACGAEMTPQNIGPELTERSVLVRDATIPPITRKKAQEFINKLSISSQVYLARQQCLQLPRFYMHKIVQSLTRLYIKTNALQVFDQGDIKSLKAKITNSNLSETLKAKVLTLGDNWQQVEFTRAEISELQILCKGDETLLNKLPEGIDLADLAELLSLKITDYEESIGSSQPEILKMTENLVANFFVNFLDNFPNNVISSHIRLVRIWHKGEMAKVMNSDLTLLAMEDAIQRANTFEQNAEKAAKDALVEQDEDSAVQQLVKLRIARTMASEEIKRIESLLSRARFMLFENFVQQDLTTLAQLGLPTATEKEQALAKKLHELTIETCKTMEFTAEEARMLKPFFSNESQLVPKALQYKVNYHPVATSLSESDRQSWKLLPSPGMLKSRLNTAQVTNREQFETDAKRTIETLFSPRVMFYPFKNVTQADWDELQAADLPHDTPAKQALVKKIHGLTFETRKQTLFTMQEGRTLRSILQNVPGQFKKKISCAVLDVLEIGLREEAKWQPLIPAESIIANPLRASEPTEDELIMFREIILAEICCRVVRGDPPENEKGLHEFALTDILPGFIEEMAKSIFKKIYLQRPRDLTKDELQALYNNLDRKRIVKIIQDGCNKMSILKETRELLTIHAPTNHEQVGRGVRALYLAGEEQLQQLPVFMSKAAWQVRSNVAKKAKEEGKTPNEAHTLAVHCLDKTKDIIVRAKIEPFIEEELKKIAYLAICCDAFYCAAVEKAVQLLLLSEKVDQQDPNSAAQALEKAVVVMQAISQKSLIWAVRNALDQSWITLYRNYKGTVANVVANLVANYVAENLSAESAQESALILAERAMGAVIAALTQDEILRICGRGVSSLVQNKEAAIAAIVKAAATVFLQNISSNKSPDAVLRGSIDAANQALSEVNPQASAVAGGPPNEDEDIEMQPNPSRRFRQARPN